MRQVDGNQTLQLAVQNHQHGDLGDAEALYLRHRSLNPSIQFANLPRYFRGMSHFL
jgi:hypothetical protein